MLLDRVTYNHAVVISFLFDIGLRMSGFKISSNFLEAANILNQIAVEKFAKILKRILHRDLAGGKTAPIFDGQESLQATVALGLTVQQLQIAIDCCSYIYEQVDTE